MELNHINLAVNDVPACQVFLETYFGFLPLSKANSALSILRNENGMVLALSNFNKATEVNYPEHFHIGFIQPTSEAVDAIYKRLTTDGYSIDPPRQFHGSWTFYLRAPGGFLIEVLH